MTIIIITGTAAINDTFSGIRDLKAKQFFLQWYYHKKRGWGSKQAKIISGGLGKGLSPLTKITQTTGSGKTLLAAIWLHKAHKAGIHTAANMPIKHAQEITDYDTFLELTNTRILLDDIRHIITSWNSEDAKIASEFANSSRKKGNIIYITTQRLQNFVPPDIREIADEIHVPYIRCFNTSERSPDGRFKPMELNDLRLSAGLDYLDKKTYDLTGKTGKIIFDTFKTMDISKSLE